MGVDIRFHLEVKSSRRWELASVRVHQFRDREVFMKFQGLAREGSWPPRGLSLEMKEEWARMEEINEESQRETRFKPVFSEGWRDIEDLLRLKWPGWFGALVLGPMCKEADADRARVLWWFDC